jgi:hypothetical protein
VSPNRPWISRSCPSCCVLFASYPRGLLHRSIHHRQLRASLCAFASISIQMCYWARIGKGARSVTMAMTASS